MATRRRRFSTGWPNKYNITVLRTDTDGEITLTAGEE